MSADIVCLSQGVQGLFIRNSRFKTTLISFNFYLPLKKESVANNALLPFLLTTCGKKYPDFSRLNYKLSKLYGAELCASAEKIGDFQLLKIGISVIDDKYALDTDESICTQACEMLLSLIFEPSVQNGSFLREDVEREKRKAIEHIRGELSDKRVYARTRMTEEMFKGKPYGIPKCGKKQDVEKVTGESLYNAWENMLKSAFVRVNVISSSLPENLFKNISSAFENTVRENITDCRLNTPARKAVKVKNIVERMEVNQGKLVMGFTSRMHGNDEQTAPLLVMCDIFGGGPYSRLFTNVREKMSLCYYCQASCVRVKGILSVDSGVDESNTEKAQQEIMNQLEIMKNGDFSDFEFESSKKSIIDSLKSYDDSPYAIDIWYSLKIASDTPISPQEMTQLVSRVDKKAVKDAANGIFLNTVFCLLPKKG